MEDFVGQCTMILCCKGFLNFTFLATSTIRIAYYGCSMPISQQIVPTLYIYYGLYKYDISNVQSFCVCIFVMIFILSSIEL